jgi:preprotein translocase subunit SecE
MEKTNPVQFVREVRLEASKVTWPNRKETLTTTAMVFVMALLAAIFLFLVDSILAFGMRMVMGF